jgi:hypothetical protein
MLSYLGPPRHHLHRLSVINGFEMACCRCSNLSVHTFLVLPSLCTFASTMRSTTRCSALAENALHVYPERNSRAVASGPYDPNIFGFLGFHPESAQHFGRL